MRFDLDEQIDIEPDRLLSLTDGIFAFAITLLVLGIKLPEQAIFGSTIALDHFLVSLLPELGIFIVSFIVISSFWVYHHEYIRVKTVTLPFLWMNMIYLLLIVLIPFTTSVVGEYTNFLDANVLFGFNVSMANIIFLIMFTIASKRNLLEDHVEEKKDHAYKTLVVLFFTTIVINFLNIFYSSSCIYLFFMLPLVTTAMDIYHRV